MSAMRYVLRWVQAGMLGSCVLLSSAALAEARAPIEEVKQLTFLFSPPSKPPFWYFDADQPRGIVFDVLQAVADAEGIDIDVEVSSRKRGDRQVKIRPDYAMARGLEWMPDYKDYQYTEPVIDSPDIFISNRHSPVKFKGDFRAMQGVIVGTHFGYFYPVLEPLFDAGILIRSDSRSELEMLKAVLNDRVSAAFMARPVARWYIRQNQWYQQFYLSDQVVSGYGIRLFLHSEQDGFVALFNRELAQMRVDGRWQEIVDRYQ